MDALRFFVNIDEDEASVDARVGAAMHDILIANSSGRFFRSAEFRAAAAREIGARSHS
jgi:hypothetical protein